MSDQDIYLVIGLIVIAFSIPSLLGAWADRRRPLVALVVVAIGGGLVALALNGQSYTWEDVPAAFVRVLAGLIR